MVKRVLCCVLVVFLISIMIVPCYAIDSTVGEIYTEVDFVGFSVGTDGYKYPQYYGVDGFIDKSRSGLSSITAESVVYYFFDWPKNADTLSVLISASYAAGRMGTFSTKWYGMTRAGALNFIPTLVGTGYLDGSVQIKSDNTTFVMRSPELINDNYSYVCLEVSGTYGTMELFTGEDFSLTTKSTSSMYFALDEYTIKATIRTGSNTSTPVYQLYDGYDTIYNYAPNVEFAEMDGTIEYGTITGIDGTMSGTGSMVATSSTPYIASAEAFALYGDDGGLVDEVFSIGDDVESIAGNMQTIVDDIQSQKDAAGDIGSATSEDNIATTQETLSSGTASINSGLSIAGDVASVSAPATMFVGLMAATVTPMLNFGNGVLYWALFAVLVGSVILFILRRIDN